MVHQLLGVKLVEQKDVDFVSPYAFCLQGVGLGVWQPKTKS